MFGVPANRYAIFGCIAAAGFAADLLTKAWFFSWEELYAPGSVYWLWSGYAGIQLSWNRGALFGMGQGGTWLFALLSIAAGCAIPIWLFVWRAAHDRWLTVALGCVMAGILGNLYDRLGMADRIWPGRAMDIGQPVYAVRDWILVRWNDAWTWPNFNLADSLLVLGAAVLFVHAVRYSDGAGKSTQCDNQAG